MNTKKPWETLSGSIRVSADRARFADCAFRVKGNSLEPLLYDGDHVLVKRMAEIKTGEIGAFWVRDRVRIMRMYQEGETRKLLPLNPEYSESEFGDGVECIGLVVGRA